MRPMTGFAGAIESRFEPGQDWIASSQVLLAMTDDAAVPIAKPIPLPGGRTNRCSIAIPIATSRRTLPRRVFSAEYFPLLRGNRRFHGIGSITQLPPKSPVLSHAIHRYGQRCRGFAACRPQAGKNSRTEVKCLNAGPDWSATRNGPADCLISPHQIGAVCHGEAAMYHKCFHLHVISAATFKAAVAGFAAARCHGS
jgi:hypothetical protein